jgi:hypothetical protein
VKVKIMVDCLMFRMVRGENGRQRWQVKPHGPGPTQMVLVGGKDRHCESKLLLAAQCAVHHSLPCSMAHSMVLLLAASCCAADHWEEVPEHLQGLWCAGYHNTGVNSCTALVHAAVSTAASAALQCCCQQHQ